MKRFLVLILVAILITIAGTNAYSQGGINDTLWTLKTPNTLIMDVKFSEKGDILVFHGIYTQFHNANTGEEMHKLPGSMEICFFNNDANFLRLRDDSLAFEIYDTETFEVIESLPNDGRKIMKDYLVSKDGTRLISVMEGGIRLWDLTTKQIIATRDFPDEENMTGLEIRNVNINCDNSEVYAYLWKCYKKPWEQETYCRTYIEIMNANTLDSIGFLPERGLVVKFSLQCQYEAYRILDTEYGVVINNASDHSYNKKLPINGNNVRDFEFAPISNQIATIEKEELAIWDIETGNKDFYYTSGTIGNFAISPDETKIACAVTSDIVIYKGKFSSTSVVDDINANKIIYPNPTTGLCNISINLETPSPTDLLITSMTGQLIRQVHLGILEAGNNQIEIDVTDLSAGTYFVELQTPNQVYTFKLIKE